MSIQIYWLRCCLLVVLGLSGPAGGAGAQDFPSKPVTLVVPAPAGSGADIIAREIAARLPAGLGQPVLVENRGGAGGIVGTAFVAKARPDGYTILLGTVGTHAINPSLYRSLPYDAAKDFVAVTPVTTVSNLLVVNPRVPAANLQALIALARSRPGGLAFASPGSGSSSHLAGELFKSTAAIEARHVPYKSGSQALTDLIAGHVDFMFYHIPAVLPFLKAGQLRALAITTSARDPSVASIPTMAEQGLPGYEVDAWMGIFAPAGTPPEIVSRLNAAFGAVTGSAEMAARMQAQGAHPLHSTPGQFADYVRREATRWRAVVERSGATAD